MLASDTVRHRRICPARGRVLSLLAFSSLAVSVSTWGLDIAWQGPAIRAVHVDALDGGVASEATMILSRHGSRNEALQPEIGATVTLHNRAEGRTWLVHPASRRYAVIEADPEAIDLAPFAAADNREKASAVFNVKPCIGYDRLKQLDDESVAGRAAEKWVCGRMRTQDIVYQWYDPRLKIVVRQEYPDGGYEQLRDITKAKVTPKEFALPKGYRKVSLAELMHP